MEYIDINEALTVYQKTIDASGGGDMGIIKPDGIESILDFIQNDDYYPTMTEKVNALVHSLCTGHNFSDGNKRVALTLGTYLLFKNGYYWAATTFLKRMEDVVLCVAAGMLSREDLLQYTHCVVEGIDYTEPLKIRLVNMIEEMMNSTNNSNITSKN